MNFFALHQGERGVPGVPGDAGEKGEPGIGITGPPVSTCLRVTSQTLSSFKGIVHTKQKIVIYSLSCCSKLSFVEHKSWNFSLLHIQNIMRIQKHRTCTSQMNNCYGTFCQNWSLTMALFCSSESYRFATTMTFHTELHSLHYHFFIPHISHRKPQNSHYIKAFQVALDFSI